jgi:hypothetical protein
MLARLPVGVPTLITDRIEGRRRVRRPSAVLLLAAGLGSPGVVRPVGVNRIG